MTTVFLQVNEKLMDHCCNHSSIGVDWTFFSSVQFSHSVVSDCDPMSYSMPGLPVHHQIPEFSQTHVHESVMPSNHLILCHPLLLLPSMFPSIRASAVAPILPVNIRGWFPLGLTGLISLLFKGLSRVFPSSTSPKHQFFSTQSSSWSKSQMHTWLLEKP